MKKKLIVILLGILLISVFSGCKREPVYDKYSYTFFDTFDTVTQVVGYTKTEEDFNTYTEYIENRMTELHKLFDKYHTYGGINNIKTINDNAGVKPVKVQKEIIDLIQFSKEWYKDSKGKSNIAFGSVLSIWSEYRDEAEFNPMNAKIPPMEELEKANQHTDINKVIVDEENSTVFLEDPKMRLDVGAIAKGFAVEIVVDEVTQKGFSSWIISVGGNVRTIGKPLDGIRDRWGVGIQNPDTFIFDEEEKSLETLFINDASVVSSGDYQRYYVVDDKVLHHLIDPDTLMPGKHYRAVTLVTEDSGLADFLSTTVFLLPFEEGKALVDSLEDTEALWIMKDGSIKTTEGMKKIMKSHGASGAD